MHGETVKFINRAVCLCQPYAVCHKL